MKQVTYRKKELVARKGRAVFVREALKEKDCDSAIRKSFTYLVTPAAMIPKELSKPEVQVVKTVDSERRTEDFAMQVKGTIYVKENRMLYRVDYGHGLRVHIQWHTHVLSS